MMPRYWQVHFVQQGNLLSAPGQTFERVRQYFAIQESTGKLLNDNKNKTLDKDDDDLGPANGKRARGRGGRYNRGNGQQSGRDSERADNEDGNNDTNSRKHGRDGNGRGGDNRRNNDCPFHGTHPWEDCWGNQHGSNYKPDYVLPAPIVNTQRGTPRNNNNNSNKNKNNNAAQQGDAHHAETATGGNNRNNSDADQHFFDGITMEED